VYFVRFARIKCTRMQSFHLARHMHKSSVFPLCVSGAQECYAPKCRCIKVRSSASRRVHQSALFRLRASSAPKCTLSLACHAHECTLSASHVMCSRVHSFRFARHMQPNALFHFACHAHESALFPLRASCAPACIPFARHMNTLFTWRFVCTLFRLTLHIYVHVSVPFPHRLLDLF